MTMNESAVNEPKERDDPAKSTPTAKVSEKRDRLEWMKLLLPSLIAIVGVAVGLMQYGTTSSFSVRQPFLEKQTELCEAASGHAARLATTIDPETWKKSREEFWMLYYGPLAIVEDVESDVPNRVEEMMVRFGKRLSQIGHVPPPLPIRGELGDASLCIAYACRDLLASRWNYGILRLFQRQTDASARVETQRMTCDDQPDVTPGPSDKKT
jgi:hypothetical protein